MAIVIVEKRGEKLLVRHLERVALGIPYTAVVRGSGRSWSGSGNAR
jgi:hypothetical protein